jgi:hypothetical protein
MSLAAWPRKKATFMTRSRHKPMAYSKESV